MIFSKTLPARDIRAIVRWLDHSLMHSRNGMYIDLFQSIGHLHVSLIFLYKNSNNFCSFFSCYLYKFILYIQPKFGISLFRKIRVNACYGDGQKVRIDD